MPVRKFKDFPKAFRNFREDLNPIGVRRVLFLKSEWEHFGTNKGVSLLYLLYRAVYMIYFFIAIGISATCVEELTQYYLIYLTHWSLITQAIYGTLFFFHLFYHYVKQHTHKEDAAKMDTLLPSKLQVQEKVIWVFVSPVSVVPLIVTLVYWAVLFPIAKEILMDADIPSCAIPANILAHAGNTLFALIEIMVMAIPVHVTHFIYLAIYGSVYTLFTGFYELAHGVYPFGVDYIYPILDWKNHPYWTIVHFIVIIVGAAILHLALWTVYILRLMIIAKFCSSDVYKYHEYTYRTRGSSPTRDRSGAVLAGETNKALMNQNRNYPVVEEAIEIEPVNVVSSESKIIE